MKKIIGIVVLLSLVGGGFWYWKSRSAKKTRPRRRHRRRRSSAGPVRQAVSSTGKVVSNLDVEIKCKASGEIVKLPFDISDAVKKGDLLLELDPRDEQQRVRQAEATVRASQARLVNARESLALAEETLKTDRQRADAALTAARARAQDARAKADRTRELLDKKLASPRRRRPPRPRPPRPPPRPRTPRPRIEELKTQARTLEQARQQIRIAEAQVETDQVEPRPRAPAPRPRPGWSRRWTAWSRSAPCRSGRSSPRASATSAAARRPWSSRTSRASSCWPRSTRATSARCGPGSASRSPSTPTATAVRGEVVRISPRGVNVSNVVTFEVKIEVTAREKALLRPEMTANVEILVAERTGRTARARRRRLGAAASGSRCMPRAGRAPSAGWPGHQ